MRTSKELRYVGAGDYDCGLILDISYDEIVRHLHSFTGVVGFIDGKQTGAKPRFNPICEASQCDYPVLSKDYYLIGYIDILNKRAKQLKFSTDENIPWDYLTNDAVLNLRFSEFQPMVIGSNGEFFEPAII